MELDSDINHASASALAVIGIPFDFAKVNSGFISLIAEDIITNSHSFKLFSLCPINISAPNARNDLITAESFLSEPETDNPFASIILAIPLIPEPPIPIK